MLNQVLRAIAGIEPSLTKDALARAHIFVESRDQQIHGAVQAHCGNDNGRGMLALAVALIKCDKSGTREIRSSEIQQGLIDHGFEELALVEINTALLLLNRRLLEVVDSSASFVGDLVMGLNDAGATKLANINAATSTSD